MKLKNIYNIKKILKFLHTNKIKINKSNTQNLIITTNYLNIPTLKLHTTITLKKFINISNYLSLQKFSTKFNYTLLKKSYTFFTNQNYSIITKSKTFKKLNFKTLIKLLKNNKLNIHNKNKILYSTLS